MTEAREARDDLAQDLEERRRDLEPPDSAGCTGWPELLIEEHAGTNYPRERPRFE